MPNKVTPLTERFWRYVQKSDGCWIWIGATTYGGYGVINGGPRHPKIIRSHRLSWTIHHGELPDDIDVCHHCDSPPCVRPDHLFLGYAKDNVADMVAKGRADGGGLQGEAHGMAKLKESDVLRIRQLHANGGYSFSKLGDMHGVSKKMAMNIVHRRAWTHI